MLNQNPQKPTTEDKSKNLNTNIDVSKIRPGMHAVCSSDREFGIVDHMEGTLSIKLKKDSNGVHHYIPLSWIASTDDKVRADRPCEQIMREWMTVPAQA